MLPRELRVEAWHPEISVAGHLVRRRMIGAGLVMDGGGCDD